MARTVDSVGRTACRLLGAMLRFFMVGGPVAVLLGMIIGNDALLQFGYMACFMVTTIWGFSFYFSRAKWRLEDIFYQSDRETREVDEPPAPTGVSYEAMATEIAQRSKERGGVMTMREAESYIMCTALGVLEKQSPGTIVAFKFSDKLTVRAAAACWNLAWVKNVGRRAPGQVLASGRGYTLVFYRPWLTGYLYSPETLRLIATEEAVHVKHPNHGAGFVEEMATHGFRDCEGDTNARAVYDDGPLYRAMKRISRVRKFLSWFGEPGNRLMKWYDGRITDSEAYDPLIDKVDSVLEKW